MEMMRTTIPKYQVIETTDDFPDWKVEVQSGEYQGVIFKVKRVGVPDEIPTSKEPIRIEIDYDILEGEVDSRIQFTQVVGYIIEDIIA